MDNHKKDRVRKTKQQLQKEVAMLECALERERGAHTETKSISQTRLNNLHALEAKLSEVQSRNRLLMTLVHSAGQHLMILSRPASEF